MGKTIIIKGADFSENGFVTSENMGYKVTDLQNPSIAPLGNYIWIFPNSVSDDGKITKVTATGQVGSTNGNLYIDVYDGTSLLRKSRTTLQFTSPTLSTIEFDCDIDVARGDYVAYAGDDTNARISFVSNKEGAKIYYKQLITSNPIDLNNYNANTHAILCHIEF